MAMTGWTRRVLMEVDHREVGSTLTGFPVLLNEDNLPPDVWENARSDGGDIRVTTDAAGSTEAAVDHVTFNTTNRTAQIWTKLTLSATSTVFYLWYGNSSATKPAAAATYGRDAVWSAYGGVWHLEDGVDSTGNGFTMTRQGTGSSISSAYIDSGFTNDHSDDGRMIDSTGAALQIGTGAATIQGWIQAYSAMGFAAILTNRTFVAGGYGMHLEVFGNSINGHMIVSGGSHKDATANSSMSLNTWYLAHFVRESNGDGTLWINGVAQTDTINETGNLTTTNPFGMGRYYLDSAQHALDGQLDEVRLLKGTALSEDWIKAEYSNQNNPGNFVRAQLPYLSFGAQG